MPLLQFFFAPSLLTRRAAVTNKCTGRCTNKCTSRYTSTPLPFSASNPVTTRVLPLPICYPMNRLKHTPSETPKLNPSKTLNVTPGEAPSGFHRSTPWIPDMPPMPVDLNHLDLVPPVRYKSDTSLMHRPRAITDFQLVFRLFLDRCLNRCLNRNLNRQLERQQRALLTRSSRTLRLVGNLLCCSYRST